MDAQKWDTVRVWIGRAIGVGALIAFVAVTWRVMQIRAEAQVLAELDKNMRDMGLALIAHGAGAEGGLYAALSREPGVLFFQANRLFPLSLENPSIVVSPRQPEARAHLRELEGAVETGGAVDSSRIERIGAESFYYTGFALHDAATVRAFAQLYRTAIAETGSPPDRDAVMPSPADPEDTINLYRLRDGVERMLGPDLPSGPALVTPSQAAIPLLIERPPSEGAVIRVLFMDGHRANVPPGEFPNQPEILGALEALRALGGG